MINARGIESEWAKPGKDGVRFTRARSAGASGEAGRAHAATLEPLDSWALSSYIKAAFKAATLSAQLKLDPHLPLCYYCYYER